MSLLLVCSADVSPVGKTTSSPAAGTMPPCQLPVSDQLSLVATSPPVQVTVGSGHGGQHHGVAVGAALVADRELLARDRERRPFGEPGEGAGDRRRCRCC